MTSRRPQVPSFLDLLPSSTPSVASALLPVMLADMKSRRKLTTLFHGIFSILTAHLCKGT